MSLEHLDVLIVGAGLSGIGASCHLLADCPDKSFALLEARERIGGTWDLFRYPGVRSDSDMYTLSYSFRPWKDERAIADGGSILEYLQQTAKDNEIEQKVRFNHRVLRAEFSTSQARWTLDVHRTDTDEVVHMTCSFLLMCSGYYRYDDGYTPEFQGIERFRGRVVHPQHWTPDIDYGGKRVVVIGSGATAVTLVPALSQTAAHVTMLQRSPSYVISLPARDPIATVLRHVLPESVFSSLMRWKNALITILLFQISRRFPSLVKAMIRRALQRKLPTGYDIDKHFTPSYDPWTQRMCLVPDGDLFEAIGQGRASVVTDQIDTFTDSGLRLTSGTELDADLVVTATGLRMVALGGIGIAIDGREIDIKRALTYKGMMITGIPNLAMVFGYANASWTLKCDLTCAWLCRLLNHMDEHAYTQCVPENQDPSGAFEPLLDFSSGYIARAIDAFPKQGSKAPWRLHQNYLLDLLGIRHGALEDGTLRFSSQAAPVAQPLAA